MPPMNSDSHGSAPDKCPVALLLIDVINDLDFEGSEQLVRYSIPMAERIAAVKKAAKANGIPVVYVNDNFGRWRSDFRSQIEHCLHDEVPGQKMVALLQPDDDDYFVLK